MFLDKGLLNMNFRLLLLTSLLSITASCITNAKSSTTFREPTHTCNTNKCKRMNQLQSALNISKADYDALPANRKRNSNAPTEEWPKPTRQEIAYDMATGKVSVFVCDYNSSKAKPSENMSFVKFVVATTEKMSGVAGSDMASCFENTYRTHQKILEPLAKSLKLIDSIQPILEEGKPHKGDAQ